MLRSSEGSRAILRIRIFLVLWAGVAALTACACDPGPGTRVWRNPKDGMEFVWVPVDPLAMREASDPGTVRTTATNPVHSTRGYWMGRTEVTVRQFRRFVKATGCVTDAETTTNRFNWRKPGFRQTGDHPVAYLSFGDAVRYTEWAGVDLPTEQEWIFACRAGTTNQFYWGDAVDDRFVWHRDNSDDGTQPVAQKRPNAWGLYDMVGNVYEWCRIDLVKTDFGEIDCYPLGGSWTRCPDRIHHDLPKPPTQPYPILPWDDDRGFRCIKRWVPPRMRERNPNRP